VGGWVGGCWWWVGLDWLVNLNWVNLNCLVNWVNLNLNWIVEVGC
jgi:hypothetical protein